MAKRKTQSRYVVISQEDQYEPGSGGKVLRNKLGIQSLSEMHDEEIKSYHRVTLESFSLFSNDHSFSMKDIYFLHEKVFGDLYNWGGKQRNVDISKDGFMFTRAIFLNEAEKEFEKTFLKKYTPAKTSGKKALAKILARIHVELILLHPFREGNGRIVRLLLMLIAQQAGFERLDFDCIAANSEGFAEYVAAIHAGQGGDYKPMTRLMEKVIT
jgi:cell filamentation protein